MQSINDIDTFGCMAMLNVRPLPNLVVVVVGGGGVQRELGNGAESN